MRNIRAVLRNQIENLELTERIGKQGNLRWQSARKVEGSQVDPNVLPLIVAQRITIDFGIKPSTFVGILDPSLKWRWQTAGALLLLGSIIR